MNFNEFQAGALRTESPGTAYDKQATNPHLMGEVLLLLGAVRDVGERADAVKRGLFYGEAWRPQGMLGATREQMQAAQAVQLKRMIHAVLGIASETAEKVDILMFMFNNGGAMKPNPEGEITKETVKNTAIQAGEEFGGSCWYEALWASAAGFDADEALARVLAQLRARYPDKFEEALALSRDLDTEAKALAGGGNGTA